MDGKPDGLRFGLRSGRIRTLLICLFLISSVAALYGQTVNHPFIQLDDKYYVSMNPHVSSGLSKDNILWSFKFSRTGERSYWHPCAWISHMLDCEIFGLNAGMHHLSNVFYHIMNVMLFFLALRLMTGSLWRSAFAASLFALHPVNVDTVAWIAERKNLLSTTFWLLTTISYWFYVQKPSIGRYCIIPAVFCLGLLTKPMLMTLPFTLLLLDYWPLGRIRPANGQHVLRAFWTRNFLDLVLEKVPLIIMAFVFGYVTIHSLNMTDQLISSQVPMDLKIRNAIVSYAVYASKLVWPHDLTIFHPFPSFVPMAKVAASLALLLAVSLAAALSYRRRPYLIVGWLWFLGTLATVSGLVQGGLWPAYAERWAYVPYMGLFIALTWGAADLMQGERRRAAALAPSAAAILAVLSALTWHQISYWKDDVTLFTRSLAIHPERNESHTGLAACYLDRKLYEKSLYHYRKSLEASPGNPFIYNDIGVLLVRMGKNEDAIMNFREALRMRPNLVDTRINLGNLLLQKGDPDSAIDQYNKALCIDPQKVTAYYNLGNAYARKSDFRKAQESLRKALQIKPDYAKAESSLQKVSAILSKSEEAIARAEEEIRSDPGNPALYVKLADLKQRQGDDDGAAAAYGKALSMKPESMGALYGMVLIHSGRQEFGKAIELLKTMSSIQPGNPETYYNMACMYARWSKPDEAVTSLKLAVEKGFHDFDLIGRDPDLAGIRSTPFVRNLIASSGRALSNRQ